MQVKTKASGIVEVPEEHIITIPAGLFGFEEYTEFALYDSSYTPFVWLQSTKEPSLAFLMIDPFVVCPSYETDIDDRELSKIHITDPSQVLVMTLVTVPGNGKAVTANFLGPLIINKSTREGMQVVLNDSKWPTKYDLMEGLKRAKEEG
ncbi:MAG TPA: flagellar assembly protein FliW [Treponema sp.]|jgi:flagellar assembly factor FliW|nr:flagellar assembly protein FliW [Treponema sp.]HBB41916.1 flagellar assembly protein FliW [Treponema sp.]HCA19902.1 flagellar assembly protein FliW [Treponema sp.]